MNILVEIQLAREELILMFIHKLNYIIKAMETKTKKNVSATSIQVKAASEKCVVQSLIYDDRQISRQSQLNILRTNIQLFSLYSSKDTILKRENHKVVFKEEQSFYISLVNFARQSILQYHRMSDYSMISWNGGRLPSL